MKIKFNSKRHILIFFLKKCSESYSQRSKQSWHVNVVTCCNFLGEKLNRICASCWHWYNNIYRSYVFLEDKLICLHIHTLTTKVSN